MGILRFSINMLKKEYKESLLYILTLCLSIGIIFIFFNIIQNTYLMSQEEAKMFMSGIDIRFSSILAAVIILFCAFMIIFANNYYLSKKSKEMAILTISGASITDITMYLFYQNVVMTLIAFPIGLAIGSLTSLSVNQVLYHYMNIHASFWYLPLSALLQTMICVVAILMVQLMCATGYVYRKDIHYLLTQYGRQVLKDNRIIQLPYLIYIFLYVFGLVILWTSSPYTSSIAVLPCCIGSLSITGMVKYSFTRIIKTIKEKRLLADRIRLISISCLYHALSRSSLLICLFGMFSSLLISFMIIFQSNFREFVTTMIGFIVIIFLLLASLLYKYSMETINQKYTFFNLYKIGYTTQQLIQIIKHEVISFYSIVFLLPGIYILSSLGLSYYHNDATLLFCLAVVVILIIAIIITAILTYISYKKSIMKTLQEGMRYE